MPANPGLIRAWALVIAVTAAAIAVFTAASLPSPVLFGSLLVGMVCALTFGVDLRIPRLGFTTGQALIGATIGALVSLLAGRLLATYRAVSTTTGTFALVAGGASGVVAVANELGVDDRVPRDHSRRAVRRAGHRLGQRVRCHVRARGASHPGVRDAAGHSVVGQDPDPSYDLESRHGSQ